MQTGAPLQLFELFGGKIAPLRNLYRAEGNSPGVTCGFIISQVKSRRESFQGFIVSKFNPAHRSFQLVRPLLNHLLQTVPVLLQLCFHALHFQRPAQTGHHRFHLEGFKNVIHRPLLHGGHTY